MAIPKKVLIKRLSLRVILTVLTCVILYQTAWQTVMSPLFPHSPFSSYIPIMCNVIVLKGKMGSHVALP